MKLLDFDKFFKRVVYGAAVILNLSRFQFFLIVSTAATLLMVGLITSDPGNAPDLSDLGIKLIVLITASAVYGAIWLFIRTIPFSKADLDREKFD